MKKIISILLCILILLPLLVACTDNKDQPVVTTPLLRIGILSDTHINASVRHNVYDRLEKALMFYKEKGVDGILITGDLQDNRTDPATAVYAMEDFQDIWNRVFPENINDLTGEYVEPMFIYGNHDTALVEQQYWFDSIGSEYEDAWIKEIKGYQFVGVHYTKEDETLVEKLLEQAKNASPDKPFFYAQHVPMAGTAMGGVSSYEGNEIPLHDELMRSYNCVVFSGHTHTPITDERAIWQSNNKRDAQFTAVSCGTLHYGFLKDFSAFEINGDEYQTQQGIYMVVDGSQITLERYSFTDLEMVYDNGIAKIDSSAAKLIGAPWKFDAMQKSNRPYDHNSRAETACQPVFPDDAIIDITELTANSVTVTVPAATVDAPEEFSDLVQSYEIQAVDPITGEVVTSAQIAAQYHVDTEPSRLDQPITIKLTGLAPGSNYTLNVYARECYQKASEPISVQIETLAQ